MTPVLTWLGQATFLVEAGGARVLIDPFFSEIAAPPLAANRRSTASVQSRAANAPSRRQRALCSSGGMTSRSANRIASSQSFSISVSAASIRAAASAMRSWIVVSSARRWPV